MPIRHKKSIKIAPGVKVNINKKSASVTVGTKGVHYTKSTNGKTTKSVGIPGTGVSYVKTNGGKKKGGKQKKKGSCLAYIALLFIFAGIIGSISGGKNPNEVSNPRSTPHIDPVKIMQPTESPVNTHQGTPSQVIQETYWISETGSKYHRNKYCSNMQNPSEVTEEEALSRGFEPCGRCIG